MKPNAQKCRLSAAFAFLAFTATSVQAAVTFVGSLTDDTSTQISSWSNTTVSKSLDIDGDNYYGSDGYTWMNTDDTSGNPQDVLHSIAQSAPSYTGNITYSGAVSGVSGSFEGADDRLLPNGTGSANVGYAGPNYNQTTGATVLQSLFSYTMNRDMDSNETIRLGVALDSLDTTQIGADSLRVVAGGTADATGLNRNGVMDMYFFDITGLNSGETIEIWGAKDTDDLSSNNFNAITIGGVTFDSVVIPEPSTALLAGIGLLALLRRRR